MNRLLVIAWFLFLCPSAFATSFVNGGFETGNLTGWSSMGDVSVQGTVFGVPPAGGLHQAVITNSPATRYGLASGLLQPTSGTPSVGISNNFASFFGTPWNGLGGNWFQLGSFSGVETTFQANSGDQLSFRWNLLFNLYPYPGFSYWTAVRPVSVERDASRALTVKIHGSFLITRAFHQHTTGKADINCSIFQSQRLACIA